VVRRHLTALASRPAISPDCADLPAALPKQLGLRLESAAIFKQFVTAINSHDVKTLMSRVHGAKSMEAGWCGYFMMCPDYWIQTDDIMAKGSVVFAVGEAGGTIDGVAWRTPPAWKAVIRDGRVAEWRVFANNKPVYEILAMRQRS
jgi:hypothetical protein